MARKTIFDSRIKNQNTTKTSRGDKFAEGWVLAVRSEVHLFAMSREERELASLWLEQNTLIQEQPLAAKPVNPVTQTCPATSVTERENVRLHQPVSGQEQRKLGSGL